jgi:hypothetical protein
MAKIERKDTASGFQAGEVGPQKQGGNFESGVGQPVPAPAPARPSAAPQPVEAPQRKAVAPEPEPVEAPAKKRYYSPREVMQRKGCIGCGGMTLALPVALAFLGALIAIL